MAPQEFVQGSLGHLGESTVYFGSTVFDLLQRANSFN